MLEDITIFSLVVIKLLCFETYFFFKTKSTAMLRKTDTEPRSVVNPRYMYLKEEKVSVIIIAAIQLEKKNHEGSHSVMMAADGSRLTVGRWL